MSSYEEMTNQQFSDCFEDELYSKKEWHKMNGKPCYLLEHKEESKYVNANMDGWTEDANSAVFYINKAKADRFCAFFKFALELPWKVTEHCFEDEVSNPRNQ